MAESQGSWWSWVQNAKEKVVSQSSEVFEFVKNDIQEFSKVVSQEASSVVSGTTSTLKEKLKLDDEDSSASQVKKSVSGFFNHVAEVFTPSPDDEDQEAIMMWQQEPVTLDRLQAAKYAFCSQPSNFLREPLESEEHYELWLQAFEAEPHEKELSNLLQENELLKHCYTTLVPIKMTHNQFCLRYFYEIEKLERAEEKRQQMKKRVQALKEEEPQIVWDDDDESGEHVEISEEMQQRLLEDYEKEMREISPKGKESESTECLKSQSNSSEKMEGISSENGSEKEARRSKSSTPSKDTEDEWEKVDNDTNFVEADQNVESPN